MTSDFAARSRQYHDALHEALAGDDSDGTGHTRALTLSANYAITRAWSLGCGLGYFSQDTDTSGGYDANTAYCSLALRLQ